MGLHNKPKESKKIDLSFLNTISSGIKAIDPKTLLAVRLIISVIFIALSLFVISEKKFLYYFLLFLSTIILGYDVIGELINEVASGKYYSIHTVLVVVSLIGYIVGMAHEVALMLLVYQIFIPVISAVEKNVYKSAVNLLGDADAEVTDNFKAKAENDQFNLPVRNVLAKNTNIILTITFIAAIAYIILTPLITNINFKESLYRAIIALIITTPASVIAAVPLTGITGAAFAESKGIHFSKGASIENTFFAKNIVFDKEGIFTSSNSTVADISIAIPSLDKNTFITFAAHAVYYSDQWFSKPITDCYNGEYQLNLISDFQDVPGSGVILKIGGKPVELGTYQYFAARRISVPGQRVAEGYIEIFVVIAGKYAGKIIVKRESNNVAKELIGTLKSFNGAKAVLLSDSSDDATKDLVYEYGFDNSLTFSTHEDKMEAVRSFGTRNTVFVYSKGIEQHSTAGIDVRISAKSKFADVVVSDLNSLVTCFGISERVNELVKISSIFSFLVKALVVFLAFTGNCSLWLAILLDSVAQVLTMLFAERVPEESIFKEIRSKAKK